MINEKEEAQRKLNSTKERLLVLDAELARLEALVAPLVMQITRAQNDRKYHQGRLEKLTRRLAAL